MESLAPPFRCLVFLRAQMENGSSLRVALKSYFQNSSCVYSKAMARWFVLREAGGNDITPVVLCKNVYRRALLSTIAMGLDGESVFERLGQLEKEFHRASIQEIDEKVGAMPIKLLIPLLLFQFPAFLILLFGPILKQLQSVFS